MKRIFITAFLAELISVLSFIWFSFQAEQAMGKDGVGNLELWQQYSTHTGRAFYLAIIIWIATIIYSISTKNFNNSWSQIAIGILPWILVLWWFVVTFGLI